MKKIDKKDNFLANQLHIYFPEVDHWLIFSSFFPFLKKAAVRAAFFSW